MCLFLLSEISFKTPAHAPENERSGEGVRGVWKGRKEIVGRRQEKMREDPSAQALAKL